MSNREALPKRALDALGMWRFTGQRIDLSAVRQEVDGCRNLWLIHRAGQANADVDLRLARGILESVIGGANFPAMLAAVDSLMAWAIKQVNAGPGPGDWSSILGGFRAALAANFDSCFRLWRSFGSPEILPALGDFADWPQQSVRRFAPQVEQRIQTLRQQLETFVAIAKQSGKLLKLQLDLLGAFPFGEAL
jgi:hypothetical protein